MTERRCALFWDSSWFFCELPHQNQHSVGPFDSLDAAVVAAKAAGFAIDRVQATRGLLPATEVARKEVEADG